MISKLSKNTKTLKEIKPAKGNQAKQESKILVFVVAYNAENHIVKVFERIPSELYNKSNIQVLVIDDCSKDKTSEVARDWILKNKIKNFSVLRNTVNQRYGGNQKLGYLYAIQNGFDFVILLHGDGQYAPELLPNFIETYNAKQSDVVLGSRMLNLKDAKKGGMPFYKQIGNIVLTTFQNFLTGKSISEYHTGYRGYSTKFLSRVPFQLNTDEFHFDTEILYQAFYTNAEIHEFPIPTHYGDEVCHVNGMRYAFDVVMSTIQYYFHRIGMFCSLKLRSLDNDHYQDKTGILYTSHQKALDVIRKLQPKSVLDIGCGPGFVSKQIKNLGIEVTGIDKFQPLPNSLDHFYQSELETTLPVSPDNYNLVMMLDVIEHFSEPENFLLNLRNQSKDCNFKLLLSTPNVAFISIRLNLILGRFTYSSRGILDITHRRLFTKNSLLRMFEECGFIVKEMKPVPIPFEAVIPNAIGRFLTKIAGVMAFLLPGLFAFQFLVLAEPKPGVNAILQKAKKYV